MTALQLGGDPQAVQRQQRDQGVLGRRPEPGRDEERTDLVAVKADGVAFESRRGRRTCTAGEVSTMLSSSA